MYTFTLTHAGRPVVVVQASNAGTACRMLVRMGHGNASAAQGYTLRRGTASRPRNIALVPVLAVLYAMAVLGAAVWGQGQPLLG